MRQVDRNARHLNNLSVISVDDAAKGVKDRLEDVVDVDSEARTEIRHGDIQFASQPEAEIRLSVTRYFGAPKGPALGARLKREGRADYDKFEG